MNKTTCHKVDHRVKIKLNEKGDKQLERKLWNIKEVPIVIVALGTVTKGLVRGLEQLEIGEQIEKTKIQNC